MAVRPNQPDGSQRRTIAGGEFAAAILQQRDAFVCDDLLVCSRDRDALRFSAERRAEKVEKISQPIQLLAIVDTADQHMPPAAEAAMKPLSMPDEGTVETSTLR